MEELHKELAIDVDCILRNVLINLSDSYPQAPSSGGTPRMREVINEVNRANDEENDLIFANNFRIIDFLKFQPSQREGEPSEEIVFNEGGYTEFIMRVINAAIEVTQENEGDSRERTVKEVFIDFNEQLFWLSQQKNYQLAINGIDPSKLQLQPASEHEAKLKEEEKEMIKNKVVNFFDCTLERNFGALEHLT